MRDLFNPDSNVRYIEINSALVSAQNRERFYVHNCGEVGQPKDSGILLKDILESGCDLTGNDKSYALTASYNGAVPWNTIERSQRNMVAERCIFQNPHGYNDGGMKYNKCPTITRSPSGAYGNQVVEPIRVGAMPRPNGELSTSQALRVYSIDGKVTTINHNGGGAGGKTGLYAIPCDKVYAVAVEFDDNGMPIKAISYADGKLHTVYEVKDGKITIKGKEYPIKLADGYYIIRKLTVNECCRLQGMPEWWFNDKDGNKLVSDTQAYKGLGNGWQLDTVKYILEHALRKIPKDEPILLLSLYDGIGTGRLILEQLGFTNVKYYAYEIDKYCIALTSYRYPDVIHKGDAFKIRDKGEIETIVW